MADKPRGNDFGNVELPENFSEGDLRASYWWVTHREKLRTTGIVAFIVVDVFFVLYSAWGFVDYLALSGVKEDAQIRSLTSGAYTQLGGLPDIQEVQVDAPTVFSNPDSRYDFLAPVQNPNDSYWVELTYQFSYGDNNDTPVRKTFILPGQDKLIAELGVRSESQPNNAQLRILQRAFNHVDRHTITSYETWFAEHTAITAVDRVLVPAAAGTSLPMSQTNFTLINQTAYTYNNVSLLVIAYRDDAIIGVNKVGLSRLKAGERHPMQLYWSESLQNATRFDVQIDVNVFDRDSYETLSQ